MITQTHFPLEVAPPTQPNNQWMLWAGIAALILISGYYIIEIKNKLHEDSK